MSKVIMICFRNQESVPPNMQAGMEQLNQRLTPDNLTPRPPQIIKGELIYIGVFPSSGDVAIHGNSIKLGVFYGPSPKWWVPFTSLPDGSYGLLRSNRDYIEIASDLVGTRTIWYIQNNDMFMASTSQRALVFFLKSFHFNDAVIPWVLSSGSLGPGLSWDRRIYCLGGNERLVLHRPSWTMSIYRAPCIFKPKADSSKSWQIRLSSRIKHSVNDLNLDYRRWALTLSGGYDSRCLLLLLNDRPGLTCITWDCLPMRKKQGSDGDIAHKLSTHFHLPHHFFDINDSAEDEWKIFERFIAIGEGRIDHIRWYMDGFKTWRHINKMGFRGIIRGDEGFGWRSVSTPSDVIKSLGLTEFSRLLDAKQMLHYELSDPIWPKPLRQRSGETLDTWRDRLYQCFRIPVILAALTDLKLPFVDVATPLLSHRIIKDVRLMPDKLRTDKSLFKSIVRSWSPPIAYASINPHPQYLSKEQTLYQHMLQQIDQSEHLSRRIKHSIALPHAFPLERKKLALRGFIMTYVNRLFTKDSTAWIKGNSN
jgi:hypothetical protein